MILSGCFLSYMTGPQMIIKCKYIRKYSDIIHTGYVCIVYVRACVFVCVNIMGTNGQCGLK